MRRPAAPAPVAAAVLAALLALAACSGRGSGAGSSTATTVAGGGVAPTLARTVTGAVDIRRLVVSNAPEGYARLSSPPFGALDLARLLEEFSDAPMEDRVILEGARFERGYTRGWLRENPRTFLGIFLFAFADEAGARSARDQFVAQNAARENATRFEVEGIPGAVGESYIQETEGEAPERVHLVTFVRGPRLYQVGGQSADLEAPVDETVAFARIEDQIAA